MRAGRLLGTLLALVVLALLGLGGNRAFHVLRMIEPPIPTVRVRREAVICKVYTTGELRPASAAVLMAPQVQGGLQIVQIAKPGGFVQQGDVVLEFNPSEQLHNLEQSRYELAQVEQEIIRAKADAAVSIAADEVELLKARFAVRRAQLEIGRNELVSAIEAQKNVLVLREAERRLTQLEQDIRSREALNKADLRAVEERGRKAELAMEQARQAIESMRLRAPIAGLVVVKGNPDINGGSFSRGMALAEFQEGDQVLPGRAIAEVVGTEEMEIAGQVSESERGLLQTGLLIEARFDSLPEVIFNGRVKALGATGRSWAGDRNSFDATFVLNDADPRLRPGVTAEVVISGQRIENALVLPRQSTFEKNGRPLVYCRIGNKFSPREIRIKFRIESLVAIEGITEGTEVALVDPESRSPGATPGLLRLGELR
jgi:HlyD family secretion protein